MHLITDLAVQCRHNNFMTQRRLSKGDRNLTPDIIALTLKDIMLFDVHVDIQITGRTAVITAMATSADTDDLILIDTGRNIDRNRLGGTDTSGTGTSRTGLFHDLTFTTALITRLGSMYRTERCTLLYSNLTRTVTIGTGLELCTLRRSRTAAVFTNVYILIGHVFFTAGGRFFKADGDGCFYIGTSAGRILTAAAPTAESAEKAVEDILRPPRPPNPPKKLLKISPRSISCPKGLPAPPP